MSISEWLSIAPKNAVFYLIFGGYVLCCIHDIIMALIDYIQKRAWCVSDYEKALYLIKKNFDECSLSPGIFAYIEHTTNRCILNAYSNYCDKLDRKKRLNNFCNKIKSLFKRK